MAKNSLLTFIELESQDLQIKPPLFGVSSADSALGTFSGFDSLRISNILQKQLELKLQANPQWLSSGPVVMGSWARGELCPGSDLDVLFLGDPACAAQVVRELQSAGVKIRSRMVHQADNLFLGVEPFDWLNLLQAKAMRTEDGLLVNRFYKQVFGDKTVKHKILKAILLDRKKRHQYVDTISHLLEPHLKTSAGGLRDIEQALQIWPLFSSRLEGPQGQHAHQVLLYVKNLFLQLRMSLHLMNLGDHLISTAQLDLSREYGFSKIQDLMREVSRSFSRAHFYSEWVFEVLSCSLSKQKKIDLLKFTKPEDALKIFNKDASLLSQMKVRSQMDPVCKRPFSASRRGQLLKTVLDCKTSEKVTQAVFRSRFIDHLCPSIRYLIGYVQHDQYHRWTADRHLLQASLELKKIFKKPKLLFGLEKSLKSWGGFRSVDWQIISWTCLYHDLAKGRDGEHSHLGESWVRKDLRAFGVKKEIYEEVAFLVRNHLQLSILAFRKNLQDEKTWKDFLSLGMTPERIRRLAVFTAIDIRATHPEAWNSWKAELLNLATEQLLAPEKHQFLDLKQEWSRRHSGQSEFIEALDLSVLRAFSIKALINDFSVLHNQQQKGQIYSVEILRDKTKKMWVRFSKQEDEFGIFSFFVRTLFDSGINIEQALVQTLPKLGVYDLFQISRRHEVKMTKALNLWQKLDFKQKQESRELGISLLQLRLHKIEIVEENDREAILSFRGADTRGLLAVIAEEMKNQNLFVIKARVHTWGGQIEDVLHCRPDAELKSKVLSMQKKFNILQ